MKGLTRYHFRADGVRLKSKHGIWVTYADVLTLQTRHSTKVFGKEKITQSLMHDGQIEYAEGLHLRYGVHMRTIYVNNRFHRRVVGFTFIFAAVMGFVLGGLLL